MVLSLCLSAKAQDRTLLYDSALWLKTQNASGLGVQNFKPIGSTSVGGDYKSGNYHRAQQAQSIISYGGSSHSYCSLPQLRLYGSFSYQEQLHKDLSWCDNFDPYNGNPFIVGQGIKGDYKKQLFDFKVGVSSLKMSDLYYAGVALDYSVGEFSRQNDPRSRAQLASWSLRPGVAFEFGNSTLGINLEWKHRKEKMLKLVSKSEGIDKYKYYDFRGLGEYTVVNPLFFTRRYVSDSFGAQLQYGLKSSRIELLCQAGYLYRTDMVSGESEESPGKYNSHDIFLGLDGKLSHSCGLSVFSVSADIGFGLSTEYIQERVVELNESGLMDSYWKTLMGNLRYSSNTVQARARWTYYHDPAGGAYKWKFGPSLSVDGETLMYFSPLSDFSWTRIDAMLEAGLPYGNCLFEAAAGAVFPIMADMNIKTRAETADKTVIRDNILSADLDYLKKSGVQLNLSAKYFFEIAGNSFYAGVKSNCLFSGRYYFALDLGLITDFRKK